MTVRFRILAAAAPALAAALALGAARCADAGHPLLLYTGAVHADPGCAGGVALGPSAGQVIGLAVLVLVGAAGSSAAVQEALGSVFDRLGCTVEPVRLPSAALVASCCSGRLTSGTERNVGSRDPPRC